MGVVYEAQDTRLPRSVAIKVIKEDLSRNVDAVQAFQARGPAGRVAEPSQHLHDSGGRRGRVAVLHRDGAARRDEPEVAAAGRTRCRSARSSTSRARSPTRWAPRTPRASSTATSRRRNIFLTASGLVKLLDFGLAKHFPTARRRRQTTDELTSAGAVAGTIHYMSPEQLAEPPRSTTAATSSPSARCSTRWRRAPVRSTCSRGTR